MLDSVKELGSYKDMIRGMVKREIRGRYKGSVLGFVWNFITPLMQILVYVAVFTIVFRTNIEDYPIFLIVGMIPWIFFSDSLNSCSGIIIQNSNMVNKIYFPRSVLPISMVLSKFVNYLISIGIVFIIIIAYGYPLNGIALLMLPVVSLLLLLFSLGMAMILSSLDVYLRDVEYLTAVALMILIWITPIMYSRNQFDNALFDTILSINPLTYFIEMFHDVFYYGCISSPALILTCTALSFGFLLVGWWVFHRLEADFAEVL